MIVTKQWLNEFINISHISLETICKTLNTIGFEVDSQNSINIPAKIVVSKVLECQKHPNADKLNVCQVDIGSEVVQIVCGASNVAAGQFVATATIGADLGNNFIIKKAKLRGVESNGMLCSSTELGLPKTNDGLMLLDNSIGELILGKELKEYPLLNDDIIEIGLTANRGDCLHILGIARELGVAYEKTILEQESTKTYTHISIGQVLEIKTTHRDMANLIYIAANIKDFTLPLLMQLRCAFINKFSSNEIAMLKTYAEHSIGVLFNFYPKQLLMCHNNICSLEITHNDKGLDSVKSNGNILNVIGVDSQIFETFEDEIIIEASYIHPEYLAQKVFETKQKTSDVYYKSSRGSNPNLQEGIKYFKTLASQCNIQVYNGSEEFCDDKENLKLHVGIKKINAIIGQEVTKSEIEKILLALGFGVKDSTDDVLSLSVPLFRHDIRNIADIAEEIVRIIGIDNITSKPLIFEEINRKNATSDFYTLRNLIRQKAICNGFFETATYAFSERKLLETYGFEVVDENLDIANPITNELNSFRTSLLLNLIQAISHNAKFGYKSIAFFEIGKIFNTMREESTQLAFVFSGHKESDNISNNGKPANIDFFGFAQKIGNIIGHFELIPMQSIYNAFIHPYQNATIIQNGVPVGYMAKLHPEIAKTFDIDETFFCAIDFDKFSNTLIQAQSVSKYQLIKRDLSVVAPKTLAFSEIRQLIDTLHINELKQYNLVDIYSDAKLGDFESLTIRFVIQSDVKTLEDDEIASIMDTILSALQEKLHLTIR